MAAHTVTSGSARPVWGSLGLLAAALGLAILVLQPLARAWHLAADLGHGWAVPLLIVWLWWERREQHPGWVSSRSPGAWAWLALVAVLLALIPLRLFLVLNPLWPVALGLHTALGVGLLLGIAYHAGGWTLVRWVAPPLIVLAGAVPWPTWVDIKLIMPLREGMTLIVTEACNASGRPAVALGTAIQLAGGAVGIDEACGGIRSLQAAVMTALFAGEWLRLGLTRRVALVLAAIGAAIVGNLLRVLFLAWCAAQSPALLDRWHDTAGWVALGLTLLLTGGVAWVVRQALSPVVPGATGPRRLPSPHAVRWALVGVLGLGLIEAGTRVWYDWPAVPVPGAVEARWTVRLPEHAPGFRREPLSARALELLRPDGYLAATWISPARGQRYAYYIEWHGGQMARQAPFAHGPTICLPYTGYSELGRPEDTIVPWAGLDLVFATHRFELHGARLTVAQLVWDPARAAPLAAPGDYQGTFAFWRHHWSMVTSGRREQPGQVLVVAMEGEVEGEILARLIAELLQPVR